MEITLASILYPVLSIGALSLVFGAALGFSAKKFAVKVDPKVEKIIGVLPGANCAGCGFAGCAVFAPAVVQEKAGYRDCPVGGASTAAAIAEIMGVDVSPSNKTAAYVRCRGTCDRVKRSYIYDGPESCVAASQLATGGNKACTYGCLGFASCQHVCPFGAIKMVDSVAVIDRDKCTSCKKCVAVCPKGLIEIVPDSNRTRVLCNSREKGKAVKSICEVGCIGCKLCAKVCPEQAITVDDNIARIDYSKCTSCMTCVEKCPTNAIKEVE